ncbi:hypothetical protein Q6D67_01220 [Haliea sp. E1-2-M8]|uniref:hypothetical protein n=1 Tax=Haliea sp. E1-2-M8 TaxID=3064706 RepID=UPI002727D2F5|nr:hypothetical protein [Haliea sp. E1-2-M8]MDO8860304.1 hypothetical protein [Haliea sp. E1-2-M8]
MGGKFGNRSGGRKKKARRKPPRYARPPDAFPQKLIKDLGKPSARIRAQNEFLKDLTGPVKDAARRFYGKTRIRQLPKLKLLEKEMLEIVRAYPDEVPEAHLNRARRIFDRAYDLGQAYESKPIWREAYRDPAFRKMLEKAREAGVVRYTEDSIRVGNAPQIKNRINNKWTALQIDHWPPRERNPFNTFNGDSLAPVSADTNEYRKLFSEGSAFPMESAPGASVVDKIEDFAQRNGLTKSQRSKGMPGGGTGGLPGARTRAGAANDAATSTKATGSKTTAHTLDAPPKTPKANLPTARARINSGGFSGGRLGLRRTLSALGNGVNMAFPDPLDLVTEPLRLGFVGSLLVGFAVEVMFYLLERRLAKVNAEGVAREYRSKVYEGMRVQQGGQSFRSLVEDTVRTVQTDWTDLEAFGGKQLKSTYTYADYQYDILFEMQAESFADGLICVLRGFRFVEVYQDVVPCGEVEVVSYPKSLSENRIMQQDRTQISDKNLVCYRYRHRMLLWDPEVHQRYIRLWNRHYECIEELKKVVALLSGREREAVEKYANRTAELVRQYRFLDAINLLTEEHPDADRFGPLSSRAKELLKPVVTFATTGDELVTGAKKLQSDRKNLLLMFAGTDIFAARRKDARSLLKHKASKVKIDPLQFLAPFSKVLY